MNSAETVREPETITTTPATKPVQDDSSTRGVDWDNPRVAAILSAAAKCFARKGFSATTLAEIGKELGLRKSIVHYYFASKAALIHEVQSFSQHRYLQKVREAVRTNGHTDPRARMNRALASLWEVLEGNRTSTHLNIEVWSASRRDPELKRRAAILQRDARNLIADGISDVLGAGQEELPRMRAMSTLVLAVLNGLAVAEFLEGDAAEARRAYDEFLRLLRMGMTKTEQAATVQ